jgi:TolB-like protein/DNA-binding winged helix-turn-helix (wHTH) protein
MFARIITGGPVLQASSLEAAVLRFGPFELDMENGEMRRSGRVVKLQPQPFQLLTLLVSRSGSLVTRDEIRERLWGGETFVDFEQGENHCVRQIRAALGDDARNPRYIQTVPRKGYRFVAVVSAPEAEALPAPEPLAGPVELLAGPVDLPPAESVTPAPRPRLSRLALWTCAGVLAVSGASLYQNEAPAAARIRLAVLPLADLTQHGSLASGLTYEITTQLVRHHADSLNLVPGLSTRAYALQRKTAGEVARELGADYLLEGSLQHIDGRVHVTVQLTDARRQTPIWAQSYVRRFTDVLSLQNELAHEIVGQVATHLP